MKKLLKLNLLGVMALLCLALGACSRDYVEIPEEALPHGPSQKVFIALADDFNNGEKVYGGSGLHASSTLQEALTPLVGEVFLAKRTGDHRYVVNRALENDCRYLFVPIITNWDRRPPNWDANKSTSSVMVYIYDLEQSRKTPIYEEEVNAFSAEPGYVDIYPCEEMRGAMQKFAESLSRKN